MPIYIVTARCHAMLRETWRVEADSAEEARQRFDEGNGEADIEFVEQEIEDEHDRVIVAVRPVREED